MAYTKIQTIGHEDNKHKSSHYIYSNNSFLKLKYHQGTIMLNYLEVHFIHFLSN